MIGYGLPRHWNTEQPDKGDLFHYGLKSCLGRLKGKGGEIRSYIKSASKKKKARRKYKKRQRRMNKLIVLKEGE